MTNKVSTFALTDTKLYVPAVTISSPDNAKLLQKLKPGCKRTVKWNNYQSKATLQRQNQYLVFRRNFAFLFENNAHRANYKLREHYKSILL